MAHRQSASTITASAQRHLALARFSAETLQPIDELALLEAAADALRSALPDLDCAVAECVSGRVSALRVTTTHDATRREALLDARIENGAVIVPVRADPAFDGRIVALAHDRPITADDVQFLAALGDVLCGALRRRHADATLRRQALHDALTDLPNRRLLERRLTHALSTAARGSFTAVLLLDLDGFKDINDVYGHRTGDEVLRAAATRLKFGLRPDDSLARLGGDEFVALCEGLTGPEQAVAIGERLLRALADPLTAETDEGRNTTHALRASIGIACVSAEVAANAPSLIRDADLAMYEAKGAGRNRVALFEENSRRTAVQHLEMVGDLRTALTNGELRLVFQPLVRLEDERPIGAEALIRWRHPERGDVSPALFIPAAEQAGLMGEIGAWVLDESIACLQSWSEDPATAALRLSVNISAAQISGIADQITQHLHQAQVAPSRLVVEITETALLQDQNATWAELDELRRHGVGVALDDFGTGFSSLSHVAHFPVTEIKLDRAFVAGILDRPADAAVAEAVCLMASRLDAEVVAEGIETEAQADALRRLGADLGQGYLFARPLEHGALINLMTADPARSRSARRLPRDVALRPASQVPA